MGALFLVGAARSAAPLDFVFKGGAERPAFFSFLAARDLLFHPVSCRARVFVKPLVQIVPRREMGAFPGGAPGWLPGQPASQPPGWRLKYPLAGARKFLKNPPGKGPKSAKKAAARGP